MNTKGLTLIELLVAIVLSAIVAFFALDLMRGERDHYVRTRDKIKLQDNAREAVRIIEEELRNAGFSTRIGSGRITGTVTQCPEVKMTAEGASVRVWNTSLLDIGDSIAFRYYEPPSSGGLTTCGMGAASTFREVGYRLKSGRLERYMRDDTTSEKLYYPILENVVTMQIRLGSQRDTGQDLVFDTSSTGGIRDPSKWFIDGATMSVGSNGSDLVVKNFSSVGNTATFIFKTPIDTALPGMVFRMEFELAASADFLRDYDSTISSDFNGFRIGIWNSTDPGSAAMLRTVSIRPPTIPDMFVPMEVDMLYGMGQGKRYNLAGYGFRLNLKGSATPVPGDSIMLRHVRFSRITRGKYFQWFTNPTPSQLAYVSAIRVNLLVKTNQANKEGVAPAFSALQLGDPEMADYVASGSDAKRSHILVERIIPVVNNARDQ